MGLVNKLCWFAAGCAAGYFVSINLPSFKNYGNPYTLIRQNNETYVHDKLTEKSRILTSGKNGPVLGTIEQRVQDIFDTDKENYKRLLKATKKYSKK